MCLGIPGKIINITDHDNHLGQVEVSGVKREINLSCVMTDGQTLDDLLGTWVLIHVGFAMSILDEEEAKQTLDILSQMGELQTEQEEMRRGIDI